MSFQTCFEPFGGRRIPLGRGFLQAGMDLFGQARGMGIGGLREGFPGGLNRFGQAVPGGVPVGRQPGRGFLGGPLEPLGLVKEAGRELPDKPVPEGCQVGQPVVDPGRQGLPDAVGGRVQGCQPVRQPAFYPFEPLDGVIHPGSLPVNGFPKAGFVFRSARLEARFHFREGLGRLPPEGLGHPGLGAERVDGGRDVGPVGVDPGHGPGQLVVHRRFQTPGLFGKPGLKLPPKRRRGFGHVRRQPVFGRGKPFSGLIDHRVDPGRGLRFDLADPDIAGRKGLRQPVQRRINPPDFIGQRRFHRPPVSGGGPALLVEDFQGGVHLGLLSREPIGQVRHLVPGRCFEADGLVNAVGGHFLPERGPQLPDFGRQGLGRRLHLARPLVGGRRQAGVDPGVDLVEMLGEPLLVVGPEGDQVIQAGGQGIPDRLQLPVGPVDDGGFEGGLSVRHGLGQGDGQALTQNPLIGLHPAHLGFRRHPDRFPEPLQVLPHLGESFLGPVHEGRKPAHFGLDKAAVLIELPVFGLEPLQGLADEGLFPGHLRDQIVELRLGAPAELLQPVQGPGVGGLQLPDPGRLGFQLGLPLPGPLLEGIHPPPDFPDPVHGRKQGINGFGYPVDFPEYRFGIG